MTEGVVPFLILLKFILQIKVCFQDISYLLFTVGQDRKSFIISLILNLEANEMLQYLSGISGLFVLKIPYKSQPYSIEELLQAIPLDTTCNLTCYMSKAIKDRTPSLYAGMY